MTGESDPLPRRPRLANHVLVRRHVVDGEVRVVLHDQQRGDAVQLGPREWAVLEAADGTRELEGIVVAARRTGGWARVAAVRELLTTLTGRGMVEPGDAAEADDSTSAADAAARVSIEPATSETDAAPRALVPLAEGLRCDGGGTCCRLYGTVMLSKVEAHRVVAVLPSWRVGPLGPDRWFTPMRGSEPTAVVTAVARDGACGWLQDDGLCAVHAAAGAAAKPRGCRLFPRVFVDDGEAVHVSLKPECPCVLDPGTDDAESLLEPGWSDAAQLPVEVVVDELPSSLALDSTRTVTSAQVREWVRALKRRPAPRDLAATLWAMAAALEREGLAADLDEAWTASPPAGEAVHPWLMALHAQSATRAREHAAWRSEHDLVRQASTALAMLTLVLRDLAALNEALHIRAPEPAQEARYLATGLHGYRWFLRDSLVGVLRDEALRVWMARSLPAAAPQHGEDPHWRAPLALVEALLRAHGIGAYVRHVGEDQNS